MDDSLKKYIRRDRLKPICDINSNDRDHLFDHASVRQLDPNTLVNAQNNTLTYLLEGEVSLYSCGFEVEKFTHNDERALSPLFNWALDEDSALTTSHGAVLDIDRELFDGLYSQQQAASIETSEMTLEEEESTLFEHLLKAFQQNRLQLPALPEAALKIRQVINSSDIGTKEIIQIVQTAPVLHFIDEHPGLIKKPEALEKSMSNLRLPISRLLFKQWEFDSDFLQVVEQAENWTRDTGELADYVDIVIAARLLYLHRTGRLDENLVLDLLPVIKKLDLLNIDDSGLFFFEQAQQEIEDTQRLLRA